MKFFPEVVEMYDIFIAFWKRVRLKVDEVDKYRDDEIVINDGDVETCV